MEFGYFFFWPTGILPLLPNQLRLSNYFCRYFHFNWIPRHLIILKSENFSSLLQNNKKKAKNPNILVWVIKFTIIWLKWCEKHLHFRHWDREMKNASPGKTLNSIILQFYSIMAPCFDTIRRKMKIKTELQQIISSFFI